VDLRESSIGFYRVWLCAIGAQEGLLIDLADIARTPAALARRHGLDEAMTQRWCRAANGVGILGHSGASYWLRREHRRTLGTPKDADYLGHHFEYVTAKSLRFGALPSLLRGKAERLDLAEVYALATSWDHLAFFERVLPREPEARRLLSRGCDVLDLGAGLGAWTREARQRFPRSRFTMAEVKPARGQISLDEIRDGAFDLVFLGEVLGASGDPTVPLTTARRALRPGATMHALEGLAPSRSKVPRGWGERLVLAMDFDFALDGSRFLTRDEADAALRASGLVGRRIRDVGGSLYHLRAHRPKRSA